MGKLREINIGFDKQYRTDLNWNFAQIEADILALESQGDIQFLLRELARVERESKERDNELANGNLEALLQSIEDAKAKANNAAANADVKAKHAETQGDHAKVQGDYAKQQGDYANLKGEYANEKAILAGEAAAKVEVEISDLSNLKIAVTEATQDANNATIEAGKQSTHAETQGNYAKIQGDYAKAQGDAVQDVFDKGLVASVNNKTGAVILNSADVGAIASSEKGVADGVAGLNANGKVIDADGNEVGGSSDAPVKSVNGEIGDVVLSASDTGAIPVGEKGVPGGVAKLNANGKVVDSQDNEVSGAVLSVNGKTGAVVLSAGDILAIPVEEKGKADGVAGLNANGDVVNAKGDVVGLSASDLDKLNNLQKFVFGVGIRITETTDMDTLLVPGIYYTTNASGTNLLTNVPTVRPNGACIVEVRDGNGTTGLMQTIYYLHDGAANHRASSIYSRTKYGTFAEWSMLPKLEPATLSTKEKYDINKIINELRDGSIGLIYREGSVQTSSSNAFGPNCEATAMFSTALGIGAKAKGKDSTAFGNSTEAAAEASTAFGTNTYAGGEASTAFGHVTSSGDFGSVAFGSYNKLMNGNAYEFSVSNTALAIGNGVFNANSNAFRVSFNGSVYGRSAFNSSGADYAEYFEWGDGNKEEEDRVGCIVSLDGDKLCKAKSSDSYILGVISATPSVVGDSHQDDWCNKYLTDVWGRAQHHSVDVNYDSADDDGNAVVKTRKEHLYKLNPEWDNSVDYIPREERKEWAPVGVVGKLLVRDDGTCQVNGFAKVGDVDGEATHSDEVTTMRVIERVADGVVRVFIK